MFSKIACFAHPETIVPIDTLNVEALNSRNVPERVSTKDYGLFWDELQKEHQELWSTASEKDLSLQPPGFLGQQYQTMNEFLEDLPEAFCLRVTDNYLMSVGARIKSEQT